MNEGQNTSSDNASLKHNQTHPDTKTIQIPPLLYLHEILVTNLEGDQAKTIQDKPTQTEL